MGFMNWSGFAKDVGKAWNQWWDVQGKPGVALAYDMALAVPHGFDEKSMDKVSSDWKTYLEEPQKMGMAGVIAGPIAPAMSTMDSLGETLVGKGPFNAGLKALDTPREWVGRALTTSSLVLGPGGLINFATPGLMPGHPGDLDDWHKAWNASRHMSPGQALMSAIGAAGDGAYKDGQITMDELIGYNDDQGDDPAKQDGWYRWTTGALDFGANFLDPSFGAGKVAKAARLKYLIKPLKTGEEGERYLDSRRWNKTLDMVNSAGSSNEVYAKAFTQSTYGGRQADVLHSLNAYGDQSRELQTLAMRGFMGDADAVAQLRRIDPPSADKIFDAKTRDEWAELKNRENLDTAHPGTLSKEEKARLDLLEKELAKSANNAYLDPDTLTALRGTLLNQPAPRVGKIASAKYSLQQKDIYDRPIAIQMAKGVADLADTLGRSRRVVNHIDLNDEQGINTLRQYLERSGLKPSERNVFLSQYAGAPSAEIKGRIASEAEDAVIKSMADKHGLGDEDYMQILSVARRSRDQARFEHTRKTRTFVTEQARAQMQKDLKEQGIASTEFLDEDGLLNKYAQPLLTSQGVDVLPLADINQMQRVFGRKSSKFRNAASVGGRADMFFDVADDVMALWKTTVLLRGGWTMRMLSDEVLRQATLMGAFSTLTYGVRGTAHMGRNMVGRIKAGIGAAPAVDAEEETRMLGTMREGRLGLPTAATSEKNARLPMVKGGEELTYQPEKRKYASMEEAYVNGELRSEDYIGRLEQLASEGQLSPGGAEARLLSSRKDLGETKFRKELFDHTLKKIGLDRYRNPPWQVETLTEASGKRIAVDPFTGDRTALVEEGKKSIKDRVISRGPDGHYKGSDLYDFISDHRDELTWRGTELAVVPDKAGLRLAVLLADNAPKPVRVPGLKGVKERVKEYGKTAKRSQASEGWELQGRYGRYEIAASLKDQLFGKNVSANGYQGGGQADMIFGSYNTRVGRIASAGGWNDIRHADDPVAYARAWERAANHEMGSDPLVRRILLGDSDQQIIDYIDSDAAKGLRRDKAFYASNPPAWVSMLRTYADNHIPDIELADGRRLREEVLNASAKGEDYLAAVKKSGEPVPDIHGESIDHALGNGLIWKTINKTIQGTMNVLGTIPSDIFSRVPFADRSYRSHLKVLIDGAEGLKGDILDASDVLHYQDMARTHAQADVRNWLYNSDSVSVLAHKTRYLTAFMGATQDAMSAWTRIIASDPSVMVTLTKMWNAPEKAGLIVDAEGNSLQIVDGKEVWYAPSPDEKGKRVRIEGTPEHPVGANRYIVLKSPAGTPLRIFGQDSRTLMAAPKETFNTFLSLNPGAGPLVAVSVNELLTRNPTLIKDDDKFLGWLSKEILPFGPTANTYEMLMSSTMKEAWTAWKGEESDKYNSRTTAIFQTMMVDWAKAGKPKGKEPNWDEASKRAGNMGVLRLLGAALSPVQFQYKSPYQPYIDAYNLMRRQDPATADMKFYTKYGEEYFYLTGRVTKSMAGLPTTVKGQEFFEQHKDLIAENPDLLGLIMGEEGGGEFNKSVYEWGKLNGLTPGDTYRRQLKPEEARLDIEKRLGWVKYTKFMDAYQADLIDRGLKSDRQSGAEDLVNSKRAFLEHNAEQNPAWADEYFTVDSRKNEERINGMIGIAHNESLRGRGDIQGLTDYLIMREQMRGQLSHRASSGGAKTLDAAGNADLADMWDDGVMDLIDRNPQFAQLYNRWLSHDKF